jgi:hypothetical protein
MPTFGRKPSGNDIGVGHVAAGQIRGTIAGRVSANGWLYRFGARVGKQAADGASATYQQALYRASGSTITTREGVSEHGVASTPLTWGGNGANQTVKPTAPIMVRTGRDYALPIRGLSGALAHGMDHAGVLMHDRSITSFPDPFGATNVRPEGRLSTWAEIQTNRAPKRPSGLAPNPDANVVVSPTLGADFRDDDELLPGFSLGQGDTVKSYRFEVWNAARTSRLRDSGKLTATGAQQTARRVTWTPAALVAGAYVARCTVWDQFDVPSPQAEWGFTVNTGGAASPAIKGSHLVGEQGGYDLVNRTGAAGDELGLVVGWAHSSGYAATAARLRTRAGGGTVVRAAVEMALSLASGGETEITITAGSGAFAPWVAFTGGQRYTIEVQFQDTAGGWSQWVATAPFVINAAPGVPTGLDPASGAFSEPPQLSAVIADHNDDSAALTPEFAVRPAGDPGVGVIVPPARRSYAGGRHYAQLAAAELPGYQGYEWRARGIDLWGKAGDWSLWQAFTFAEPPVITVSSPAPDAALDHGTPTISFTVNRSILRYRLRLWNQTSGALAYEYGTDTVGSGGSHTVPVGILRNLLSYRCEIEVTDTTGLTGRVTRFFSIAYTPPAALAALTVERTPGPFESAQPEATWSQITVSWPEPSLAQAPVDEFQGYVLRMTALSTGVETIAAVITSRDERVFIHRTPTSGEVYDYSVAYLVERNEVDTVESVRASQQLGVNLVDTVIVTLDADALGAPLRFWEEREVDWRTDVEIVPSWTDQPIGFQGSTNSDVIAGTFVVMDDELGSYTARDLVTAVRAMAGPTENDRGRLRPRVICYRDPKGRNLIVMLSAGGEADRHNGQLGEMHLTFSAIAVEIGGLIGTSGMEGIA